ncbi:unnamed protein product [Effrenium voratum]|nr:unnamed protein product [Effrenium voratum]
MANVLPQLTFTVVGVCSLLLVAIVAFPCIESLALCHHLAWPASRRDARAAIVACVAIMSVLTDAFIDTKIAFALTGALGLSLAAYVMPALLYLRLRGSSGGRWRQVIDVKTESRLRR